MKIERVYLSKKEEQKAKSINPECPECGSNGYISTGQHSDVTEVKCPDCGEEYEVVIVDTPNRLPDTVDGYLAQSDTEETVRLWAEDSDTCTVSEYLLEQLESYANIRDYLEEDLDYNWDEFPGWLQDDIRERVKELIRKRYNYTVNEYYAD
jgi:transcription elongation factor Elf1